MGIGFSKPGDPLTYIPHGQREEGLLEIFPHRVVVRKDLLPFGDVLKVKGVINEITYWLDDRAQTFEPVRIGTATPEGGFEYSVDARRHACHYAWVYFFKEAEIAFEFKMRWG